MTKTIRAVASMAIVTALVGCAHFPTKNETIAIPVGLPQSEVLELVIDAGREVGFPPATKIDKANGVVEFGSYELPVTGITAQARVRNKTMLSVTVRRGSVYIPLAVGPATQQFKDAIKKKFRDYKPKK